MVINHDLKYIFVSTPKSGTNTMYHVLQEEWGGVRYGGYHETKLPDIPNIEEYTIFITCRFPLTRLVSAWYILTTVEEYSNIFLPKIGSAGFPEFVDWFLELPNDRRLRRGKGYDILSSQTARLSHIPNIQFLGIEEIEEEFQHLPFVDREQEFPVLLKRDHPTVTDAMEQLTHDQIDSLFKWFEEDMALYLVGDE